MNTSPNKLPHIGWSTVKFLDEKEKLFEDIKNEKDFYFIHSYYFSCKNKKNIIATTKYNEEFPSIVKNKSIYGVQFHPEKSLKNGIKLFENFLRLK
jgi:glutamine amidotransferase